MMASAAVMTAAAVMAASAAVTAAATAASGTLWRISLGYIDQICFPV